MNDLSELEADLLLLFYTFSDQYGKVDMKTVSSWAKSKMDVTLPPRQIFIKQKHIDALMNIGVIPDSRDIMKNISTPQPKRRRKAKD